MARQVFRYRKCRQCQSIFPAGKLGILNYRGRHYHKVGGSKRRCPKCGRVGFTQDFPIARPSDMLV